jgi:hypothetical protein
MVIFFGYLFLKTVELGLIFLACRAAKRRLSAARATSPADAEAAASIARAAVATSAAERLAR